MSQSDHINNIHTAKRYLCQTEHHLANICIFSIINYLSNFCSTFQDFQDPYDKEYKIHLTRNTRSIHKIYHMNFDVYEVEHCFVLLSYLSSEVSFFVLGLMSLSTYFGFYQDGACLWKTVWVAMDQLVCIELPFIHQVLNNGVSTTNLKCLVWLKRGIKPRTSQTQSKCSTIRLPVLLGSKV